MTASSRPTRRDHLPTRATSCSPSASPSANEPVEELFATGIEDRILPVGAQAPEFALKDSNGKLVRSRDLLALGPLVIKFFRGRWCPYCVTELETWRDLYGQLRERGALMVAIGPQIERQSDFMANQHGLPFPVLSDPGNAVAEKFGLVYTIPEYHRDYYLSILVNIPFVNGDKSWRLPLPATYVIAKDGKVVIRRSPRRLPRPPRARRSPRRCLRHPPPLTPNFGQLFGCISSTNSWLAQETQVPNPCRRLLLEWLAMHDPR